MEIITSILSGIIGITLAFLGWGYWALVIQGISTKAFRVIGYFIYTRWQPLLTIQVETIKDILGFSGNLLGFRMINYWSRNADNLIIGRTLGSTQLGFYNQAFTLMMYPIRMLSFVINPSIQPVFATAQDEPEKIAPTYLLLLESLALITLPMGLFLHIYAGPVIRFLWGNRWEASIPVFEVLAFLTMVQPLVVTSDSVFIARNKTRLLFRLSASTSLIIITGIAIGSRFGILGVATGYAIAYLLLATPLTLFFLAQTLQIRIGQILVIFIKPIIITITLVPALLIFRSLDLSWSNLGILASAGGVFLLIWVSMGYLLYRKKFQNILQVLMLRFNFRSGKSE
jgi:PST family polysaccharide transporter